MFFFKLKLNFLLILFFLNFKSDSIFKNIKNSKYFKPVSKYFKPITATTLSAVLIFYIGRKLYVEYKQEKIDSEDIKIVNSLTTKWKEFCKIMKKQMDKYPSNANFDYFLRLNKNKGIIYEENGSINMAKNEGNIDLKNFKELARLMKKVKVYYSKEFKTLAEKFLEEKKVNGTEKEKSFYQNMKIEDFIKRLYEIRPMSFCGEDNLAFGIYKNQFYINNLSIITNDLDFFKIENFLTEDERVLSSNLLVFGKSFAFSDGGNYINIENYFKESVFIGGVVGLRLEKKGENEDRLIYGGNQEENKFFIKIYKDIYGNDILKENVKNYDFQDIFYKTIIKDRLKTFLMAVEKEKIDAAVYINGVGCGYWAGIAEKSKLEEIIFKSVEEILENNTFNYIKEIKFSYFNNTKNFEILKRIEKEYKNINFIYNVKDSRFKKRNDKLKIFTLFAYDGNSWVGNEFWIENYCSDNSYLSSDDPRLAISAMIQYFIPRFNEYIKYECLK